MRKRRIVFGILVQLVGLLFVLFVAGNAQVGGNDIGLFIAAISAIIDQFSLVRDFHVIQVVAFYTEVHSLYT
jgi:hypothetical protein